MKYELFNQWNKLRRDIVRMRFVRRTFRGKFESTSFDFSIEIGDVSSATNQTVDRAMSLRGPTFNPPVPNMRAFPRRETTENELIVRNFVEIF